MIKDKAKLQEFLYNTFMCIAIDSRKCEEVYTYANKTYDIPKVLVLDYLTLRKAIQEASDFELFILLDSVQQVVTLKHSADYYFSEIEISTYKKSKFVVDKVSFPLKFKMVEINHDQWIGKIDVQTLMDFRKLQIIRYNVNTQRVMDKIINGVNVIFKLALNFTAVNAIKAALLAGTYISNTITLNIPVDEDIDADFYYDEENCTLVIKSLKFFDITDGYHRYIAMCQIIDQDPKFNYNMELRITNFTSDKAKQFIFQEDQKTQMRKADSNSMNMNNPANLVLERLNDYSKFNLKGSISRNEGLINFSDFADMISYFFFKKTKKQEEKLLIIKLVSELSDFFNGLTEYDMNYLVKPMDYNTLLVATYFFKYHRDKEDVYELIEKVAKRINESKMPVFTNKGVKKVLVDAVEKVANQVMEEDK